MVESGKSGKTGAAREQRLAQALRENLRRRKAQARGRKSESEIPQTTTAREHKERQ